MNPSQSQKVHGDAPIRGADLIPTIFLTSGSLGEHVHSQVGIPPTMDGKVRQGTLLEAGAPGNLSAKVGDRDMS